MDTMLHNITADPGSFMFLMIFGVLGVVGLAVVVMLAHNSVTATRERERTRREIAGHVANGALSPDEGERLLAAGRDTDAGAEPARRADA